MSNDLKINPQAEELNTIIKKDCPAVFSLLSDKGKAIFFPKEGILAQAAEAKGKKINATIGTAVENNGSPMRLKVIEKNLKINPKDVFPYAPSFGKPELRNAWLSQIKKKNPSLKSETSMPVVTNALTHGLSMAGYLFINQGDRIVIPDKFWGNYKLTLCSAYGAVLDTFETFNSSNGFNTEGLKEKLKKTGKKILLLNFPNNPTGYAPTNDEAKKIVDIIKEQAKKGDNILVLCDDAYFGLVYEDGIYKESLFSLLAGCHENVLAVKLDAATKEDYAWGFRVGFITFACKGITQEACRALEAKTAGAIRGNISNVSHSGQSIILNAILSPEHESEKKQKYLILKERYLAVKKALENKKYKEVFSALPYNSGYFMCVEPKKGIIAETVRQRLLEKYDTGVISTGNLLRIAFSGVRKSDIKKLFDNIYAVCFELKK